MNIKERGRQRATHNSETPTCLKTGGPLIERERERERAKSHLKEQVPAVSALAKQAALGSCSRRAAEYTTACLTKFYTDCSKLGLEPRGGLVRLLLLHKRAVLLLALLPRPVVRLHRRLSRVQRRKDTHCQKLWTGSERHKQDEETDRQLQFEAVLAPSCPPRGTSCKVHLFAFRLI